MTTRFFPSNPGGGDVIVVGAGIGGVCSALAAARAGARVLVLEGAPRIGGTGVHSPVGCVCEFWDANKRPVVEGLHREIFPQAYENFLTHCVTYDEQELLATYERLLGAEPNITVRTGVRVSSVRKKGKTLTGLEIEGEGDPVEAAVFVDGTGDGNLAALAGADFQKGRRDGSMQPSTVTFKVSGIDETKLPASEIHRWSTWGWFIGQLTALYKQARADGKLADHPRESVLCFPYPDGRSLLFNSTRIHGVDPTDPASVGRAWAEGERQARELFAVLQSHPVLAPARIETIFRKLGVREGRRIVGDYLLNADDLLEEARFDDMIAASSYTIDIHDVHGGRGTQVRIPGSGYYHIPYRSLVAKSFDNLLMGSRCISGTHVAHSSYRVMSSLSAIGQATGVAAALASVRGGDVRAVGADEIRWVLRRQRAFVEGSEREPVASPAAAGR